MINNQEQQYNILYNNQSQELKTPEFNFSNCSSNILSQISTQLNQKSGSDSQSSFPKLSPNVSVNTTKLLVFDSTPVTKITVFDGQTSEFNFGQSQMMQNLNASNNLTPCSSPYLNASNNNLTPCSSPYLNASNNNYTQSNSPNLKASNSLTESNSPYLLDNSHYLEKMKEQYMQQLNSLIESNSPYLLDNSHYIEKMKAQYMQQLSDNNSNNQKLINNNLEKIEERCESEDQNMSQYRKSDSDRRQSDLQQSFLFDNNSLNQSIPTMHLNQNDFASSQLLDYIPNLIRESIQLNNFATSQIYEMPAQFQRSESIQMGETEILPRQNSESIQMGESTILQRQKSESIQLGISQIISNMTDDNKINKDLNQNNNKQNQSDIQHKNQLQIKNKQILIYLSQNQALVEIGQKLFFNPFDIDDKYQNSLKIKINNISKCLKFEKILTMEGASIGRSKENTIPIDNAQISREHVKILYQDDGFYIQDIGSSSGTFLKIQEYQLKENQKFYLGVKYEIKIQTCKMKNNICNLEIHFSQLDQDKKIAEILNLSLNEGQQYIFGRDKEISNYFIDDQQKTISSKHAKIFHEKRKVFIKDCDSVNGTWIRLSDQKQKSELFQLQKDQEIKMALYVKLNILEVNIIKKENLITIKPRAHGLKN